MSRHLRPHGFTFMSWIKVQSVSQSVMGMLRFMSFDKPAEHAHFFLFRFCVCFCLYGLFNCISFHKFFRHLSAFSLCSSSLISVLFGLSTIYLFMKVSFSPDIIFCGWPGLKHQLINLSSHVWPWDMGPACWLLKEPGHSARNGDGKLKLNLHNPGPIEVGVGSLWHTGTVG